MSYSEVDRLALEQPEEYHRLLHGYDNLLGDGDRARDDLRIATVPATAHLDARRYPLGLETLTALAGPLRPREFAVCGAYTGQGKTSYAERVGIDNALLGHSVLFASLEMAREDIRDRILAKLTKSGVESIYWARRDKASTVLTDAEKMFSNELSSLYLWHPERKERTIQAITKRAENLGTSLLIIDYTRKLTGWAPGGAGTEIVDWLWEWIKRTNVTVLLLSQMKRWERGGRPRRPTIYEYQDTSALETTSTRSIILWRPFAGKPSLDHIVEFIVGKNRGGVEFTCHAHWVGETGDFFPMTEQEEENARCCQRRKKATQ